MQVSQLGKILIEPEEPETQQKSPKNIRCPVNACCQSPNHHERRKCDHKHGGRIPSKGFPDPPVNLELQGRHHAQDQERCRRGVRSLQNAVYQDRPVIDGHHFKEQVTKYYQNIVKPQKYNIPIDPEKASPFDQLDCSKSRKTQANCDWDKPEPIRNRVQGQVDSGKIMKPQIEGRKANLSSIWSDRLHVNSRDQERPQHESS